MNRSWEELGLKFHDFKKDLFDNWYLILIVAVFLQLPIVLIGKFYWTELLTHIKDRIPLINSSAIGYLILIILVIPLLEELIYRGLFQQRLSWYLNGFVAVLIASFIFGLQHFTPGKSVIVAVDVAGVVVDGMIYGLIFARCRNVFVSWTAHVAADLIGLAFLLLLV